MQSLILARHAETEWNLRETLNGDPAVGVPLTARGCEQARALGLDAGHVDVVAHTAFARTRDTAELAWPDVPQVEVPELNEISFGRFEGTRWQDGYEEWVRTSGPLDDCPGGGESRAAAIGRYARGYRTVLELPQDRVALVAHGAHVRYVLLALEGESPPAVLERVPLATPFRIARSDYARAVDLIEAWASEPVWA